MKRWPGWVYDDGDEPDYSFTMSNERTFLAWIRTSLALLAAGVALDVVELSIGNTAQTIIALILLLLGLFGAIAAWIRWAVSERALRRDQPLPGFGVSLIFTLLLIAAVAVLLVALL